MFFSFPHLATEYLNPTMPLKTCLGMDCTDELSDSVVPEPPQGSARCLRAEDQTNL